MIETIKDGIEVGIICFCLVFGIGIALTLITLLFFLMISWIGI